MPFENEFAKYEPLRRIVESEKVKNIQERYKLRELPIGDEELTIIPATEMQPSDWQPDMVIAIDGSHMEVPAKNGFPNAEIGYVAVASVLVFINKIRELDKQEFIDPVELRKAEKTESFDSVFPGCNVILDNEITSMASMRKAVYEEFKNYKVFADGESLLDTYEVLFKHKRAISDKRRPKCPIDDFDCNDDLVYSDGVYKCACGKYELYSTDALRLHELMNPLGSNGEMFGQIMFTLEKLLLIHILRSFEKNNWLETLKRIAFILDGPLAVFSTASWLTKVITLELNRINEIAKKKTGQDILILGIEKSGTFVNHFEEIDRKETGEPNRIPNQSVFLLYNEYIKNKIIFSKSDKHYGIDTYFGRKFFYKTKTGQRLVGTVAFFNEYQQNLETALVNQFPRIADAISLLDELASSRYPNAITPISSAHAEASIPLNLGKRILENIAKEIISKNR
jgi:hypothetical protein